MTKGDDDEEAEGEGKQGDNDSTMTMTSRRRVRWLAGTEQRRAAARWRAAERNGEGNG